MSVREPRGKSQRTKTANKIDALATDIENGVKGLRALANDYRNPIHEDRNMHIVAANVDFTLDHIRRFTYGHMTKPFGKQRS